MDASLPSIERYRNATMFVVSALFLMCLAGFLHIDDTSVAHPLVVACQIGMAVLHPFFALELFACIAKRSRRWKQSMLYWILPPLRICARDIESGASVWFPRLGWQTVDDDLRTRVVHAFHYPMIGIALMVVPLLASEMIWQDAIQASPTLTLLTQSAAAVIWCAFAAEFLVMISLVENKIRYCREHWIDIAIILLPLIAFLRAVRLGRLLRVQGLARTARVYRLRGMLMRVYRALLMMKVIDRWLRPSPEKRVEQLRTQLADRQQEIDELQSELDRLESTRERPTIPVKKAA